MKSINHTMRVIQKRADGRRILERGNSVLLACQCLPLIHLLGLGLPRQRTLLVCTTIALSLSRRTHLIATQTLNVLLPRISFYHISSTATARCSAHCCNQSRALLLLPFHAALLLPLRRSPTLCHPHLHHPPLLLSHPLSYLAPHAVLTVFDTRPAVLPPLPSMPLPCPTPSPPSQR